MARRSRTTHYPWKSLGVDVTRLLVRDWTRKMYESIYKNNRLLQHLIQHSDQTLHHYQDQSIELDMIHEWMTEDRIYRG